MIWIWMMSHSTNCKISQIRSDKNRVIATIPMAKGAVTKKRMMGWEGKMTLTGTMPRYFPTHMMTTMGRWNLKSISSGTIQV